MQRIGKSKRQIIRSKPYLPIDLTILDRKNSLVRSIQKSGTKVQSGKPEKRKAAGARFLLLRPAGYPLKSLFQEHPVVSDARLFELYAREQWYGEAVKPGFYLFDRRLYPDFAFQVVKVFPRFSVVGTDTTIKVEQKAEPKNTVKYDVHFDDVIGQETAKRKVKIVQKFLHDPESFGRWAPRNILFYGVSGTGKTMIAKALSSETKVPMLPVKSTSLIGEFVGEGARQIHSLYEKAEEMAPCIVFIDELDAIALDRRYQDLRGDVSEIVNSLLTEMDGIMRRKGVCTIAATNQIEVLDSSVRSRFEEEIEFKLPSLEERLLLLEKNALTLPLELVDVNLREIARQTEGFSGRDLVEKVLKASLHHAIMDESSITQKHLEETLPKARKEYRQPPKEMFS
jgi:AAA family ATPase